MSTAGWPAKEGKEKVDTRWMPSCGIVHHPQNGLLRLKWTRLFPKTDVLNSGTSQFGSRINQWHCLMTQNLNMGGLPHREGSFSQLVLKICRGRTLLQPAKAVFLHPAFAFKVRGCIQGRKSVCSCSIKERLCYLSWKLGTEQPFILIQKVSTTFSISWRKLVSCR